MSTDVTLRWVGAPAADADTDYRIEVNDQEAGIGEAAWSTLDTQGSTSPYVPVATTLSGGLSSSATSITLTDGASFAEGDHVLVDGEMILLGVKASNTFAPCTRGIGGSLPTAHDTLAVVQKAHEIYVDAARTFPAGRHALRYRIIRVESDGESVPTEIVVVDPPRAPFSNMITVWGVGEGIQGSPAAGTVTVSISAAGAYGQDTGEHVSKTSETVTVDADGFWAVYLRKDIVRQDGVYTIEFAPSSGTPFEWTVASLPDQDSVNWLET